MEHETDLDPAFINAFLAGDASPDAEAAVRAWIGNDPARARLIDTLRHTRKVVARRPRERSAIAAEVVRAGLAYANDDPSSNASIPSAVDMAGAKNNRQRGPAPLARRVSAAAWWGAGVCAVLAVIGATIIGVIGTPIQQTPETAQRFTTRYGQWSTVRLADGSAIVLAPGTSMTVHGTDIGVTGEAYFTIASRPTRPYVVRTRNAMVQVLGTRFDVRQYPNERGSRIVVEDGKISLRHLDSSGISHFSTVLTERTVAQVTDSGIVTDRNVETRRLTSWAQGDLVFNGMPLRDVVSELARAYGVEIHVPDPTLARRPILIEVSVHRQPLTQVLDLISLVAGAHYVRTGDTYLISPGQRIQSVPVRQSLPQQEKQYGR